MKTIKGYACSIISRKLKWIETLINRMRPSSDQALFKDLSIIMITFPLRCFLYFYIHIITIQLTPSGTDPCSTLGV